MKFAKPFSPDFGSFGSSLELLVARVPLPFGLAAGVWSELWATPAGIGLGANSTCPSDKQAVNSSDGNIENLRVLGEREQDLFAHRFSRPRQLRAARSPTWQPLPWIHRITVMPNLAMR